MHIFAAIFVQAFVNCMIMAMDNIKKMVCVCKKKGVVSQFTVKKICNLIPYRQVPVLVIVIPYFLWAYNVQESFLYYRFSLDDDSDVRF